MEKATVNIKDPKVRAYFDDVTDGKSPTVTLSADEYDLPEALSLSYIAQKYFGKSRAWLMQKVNGNRVNGRIAAFTDEERRQFREALQDLSKKMSAIAMTL